MAKQSSKKRKQTEKDRKRRKRLIKSALAGVVGAGLCLSNASADLISESGDFGDSFGDAFELPVGTCEVVGQNSDGNDRFDWVKFSGLLADADFTFTIDEAETEDGTFGFFQASIYDSNQDFLGNASIGTNSMETADFTGTVPADGMLFVEMEINEAGATDYAVSLDVDGAAIPEPSSFAFLSAAALLGANARRRNRKRDEKESREDV